MVPVLQMPDAVAQGSLDAAFGGSVWWASKEQALNFFTAVPFGPNASEFLAWVYYGGGQQIADELFGKYNTKALFCHLIPPEAAGWYRKELKTLDDFRGLRVRIAGYGANVIEKLGGSPQLIAPGDIYQALERGVIDGSEFSIPSLDLGVGLHQVAKNYYFPGWHQQHGFNTLWINLGKWRGMSDRQRRIVEMACNEMVTRSLAESEGLQASALEEIKKRGVTVRRLTPEVLAGLAPSGKRSRTNSPPRIRTSRRSRFALGFPRQVQGMERGRGNRLTAFCSMFHSGRIGTRSGRIF